MRDATPTAAQARDLLAAKSRVTLVTAGKDRRKLWDDPVPRLQLVGFSAVVLPQPCNLRSAIDDPAPP